MRTGFVLLLALSALGCDPGWHYRLSALPATTVPSARASPVGLELVFASVFTNTLNTRVTITNDTAATIELDSAVITLRDARADTLIPLAQWVCGLDRRRFASAGAVGDVSRRCHLPC
jgi:hypothetical protein